MQELDFLRAIGSSPLTRGKPCRGWPQTARLGLIPAHAGKTRRRVSRRRSGRAHPRSRGENTYAGEDRNLALRSSPLTRGKRQRRPRRRPMSRLIPAHAGKTVGAAHECRYGGAHPRSRGENVSTRFPSASSPGSSPLTRGKRGAARVADAAHGLIPAHAGKTRRRVSRPRSGRAHPRSRGENRAFDVLAVGRMGSSPLTRGKRTGMITSSDAARLIPAHAGKTRSSRGPQGSCWAHPRSRGENLEDNWEVLEADGSSPLTRGKRPVSDGLRVGGGLIPAHAGKTRPSSGWTSWRAAHPRSRGENLVAR